MKEIEKHDNKGNLIYFRDSCASDECRRAMLDLKFKSQKTYNIAVKLLTGFLCTKNIKAGKKYMFLAAMQGNKNAMNWMKENANDPETKKAWDNKIKTGFVSNCFKKNKYNLNIESLKRDVR